MEQYSAVAQKVRLLLNDNDEWVDRYTDYASGILRNIKRMDSKILSAFSNSELKLYVNTTNAKKTDVIEFDLRYRGQSIASIAWLNNGEFALSIDDSKAETNARDFGFAKTYNKVSTNSPELQPLFEHFCKQTAPVIRSNIKKRNEEHRVESLLISEFEKTSGAEKALTGIQPVKLASVRYPFPTPIKASIHSDVSYAGAWGGGVDILARITGNRLCIIEVKDENKSNEPPEMALKQAVAYATFVQRLLRSKCGNDWYRIFGFNHNVPPNLHLCAACAMPSITADQRSEINGGRVELNGYDTIDLHWISINEADNKIVSIESSLQSHSI